MDYLLRPWRYQYITQSPSSSECIFCTIARSPNDEENLLVYRAQHNFVVLNRFPYSSGHLMVVPYEHLSSLAAVKEEGTMEMMSLMRHAETALRNAYQPSGLNMGLNLGESAGAGVADHVHMHVLPRWKGDSNFMTVVGETRVLPEELGETYRKVKSALAAALSGAAIQP
jgi:ATP adenylyltransferase